tara:strand:+ start:285 stop:539 length:255 start_codon:yes stop_codon:yes gene_type:complete
MTNKEILKKQVIYRSTHRGTKEMDLLLGSFVKKNIDKFSESEINQLEKLLEIDDEIIQKWYFKKNQKDTVPYNKVTQRLKNFKP